MIPLEIMAAVLRGLAAALFLFLIIHHWMSDR